MNDARKIAFGLGISIYDLISGNAAKTTDFLDLKGYCPFPESFLETTEKGLRDHKLMARKLGRIISKDRQPISLRETSKTLGVSKGYVEYRFPVQARQIVDRYKLHINQIQQQKKRLALEKAIQYFRDNSSNFQKSRKHAYKTIREETGLPKFLLKHAIQSTYDALNLT